MCKELHALYFRLCQHDTVKRIIVLRGIFAPMQGFKCKNMPFHDWQRNESIRSAPLSKLMPAVKECFRVGHVLDRNLPNGCCAVIDFNVTLKKIGNRNP